MQFRRKWNGRREFTPKSSTDNFSFFNKTDIAEIEVVKLYLSVAIKAGFITPLRRYAFKAQRHVLGQVFGLM